MRARRLQTLCKRPFTFTFVRVARIAKVIKALNAREALGTDGIPVSVLKKGVECLASPLAHLVNTSFLTGKIPDIFKDAKVHPLHKGGGKSRAEPGSYRPVSILPAMSKILEGVVKQDLEKHLAAVNGLHKILRIFATCAHWRAGACLASPND
jgi:hypothetical protein